MSASDYIRILPRDLAETRQQHYDWAIGVGGYESRARHFFTTNDIESRNRTVFVFSSQQVLAFDDNARAFRDRAFQPRYIVEGVDANAKVVDSFFVQVTADVQERSVDSLFIIVDISSMTRQLIALLCAGFADLAKRLSIIVRCDYVYAFAKFGPVPALHGPIISNGPVINRLAGWCGTLGAPCGLILGIGYEEDLALGVIEELEAGAVWAFRPKNPDANYDTAIDTNNRGLFGAISQTRIVRYSPREPYALFVALDQLSALSKRDYRILIVPFGPKIFALAGILVALANFPEVGVWRVSAGTNLDPVDRQPLGDVIALQAEFTGTRRAIAE